MKEDVLHTENNIHKAFYLFVNGVTPVAGVLEKLVSGDSNGVILTCLSPPERSVEAGLSLLAPPETDTDTDTLAFVGGLLAVAEAMGVETGTIDGEDCASPLLLPLALSFVDGAPGYHRGEPSNTSNGYGSLSP